MADEEHQIRHKGLDSSTKWLIFGGIMAAFITGVFAVIAVILTPLGQRLFPEPTPMPTATEIPTPLPTFTPTPLPTATPSSPPEAALGEFLAAREIGAFTRAVELVSDYSLDFLDITREDLLIRFKSDEAKGVKILEHQIVGAQVLEEGKRVRFHSVVHYDQLDSQAWEEETFTIHKDSDGVWRVNTDYLVDHRKVMSPMISDPATQIQLGGRQVERYEDYIFISYDIITPTGKFAHARGAIPTCRFEDKNYQGKFVGASRGQGIRLEGFFDSYPVSCSFPDLMDGFGASQSWKSPELIFEYE